VRRWSRSPSGASAVLTSWPGGLSARAATVAGIVTRLRVRGYPAPQYLAVIDCETTLAVLQEFVEGQPPAEVDEPLVRSLLTLNDRQRGVLPDANGPPSKLYLLEDGPGYCLHQPLRHHDPGTAALLNRIHEIGHAVPEDAVTGTDAVHGDFHPGNVLVDARTPGTVTAVVDWTGAHAGNCGLDLVTLGFNLDQNPAAPRVREIVRERIAADVGIDALLAFTAHMALRQVDWAIRHHSPTATRRWGRGGRRLAHLGCPLRHPTPPRIGSFTWPGEPWRTFSCPPGTGRGGLAAAAQLTAGSADRRWGGRD